MMNKSQILEYLVYLLLITYYSYREDSGNLSAFMSIVIGFDRLYRQNERDSVN